MFQVWFISKHFQNTFKSYTVNQFGERSRRNPALSLAVTFPSPSLPSWVSPSTLTRGSLNSDVSNGHPTRTPHTDVSHGRLTRTSHTDISHGHLTRIPHMYGSQERLTLTSHIKNSGSGAELQPYPAIWVCDLIMKTNRRSHTDDHIPAKNEKTFEILILAGEN